MFETIYKLADNATLTQLSTQVNENVLAVKSACFFTALFVVYLGYRVVFGNKKKSAVDMWSPGSAQFDRIRRQTSPPPFPNGWFKLCDVDDIQDGRIQNVSALGLNLIVFLSKKSGKPVVMDAF